MNRSRSPLSIIWKLCAGFVIASVVALDPLSGLLLSGPNVALAQDAKSETPINQGVGFTSPGTCNYPVCAIPVVDVGPGLEYAVKKDFLLQLRFGLMLASLDALTLFTQTLAYDTAEWVASGFQGQAPGFFTDPFGEYTQNLVLDSTGEFMGSFSENFTKGAFGLDLCKPPNFPELSLDLAIGFPDINLARVGRPRPKCAWTDIVANYDETFQSLSNLDITQNINASFSTGGNDFSFGIGAHLGFFDYVAGQKNAGILSRLEGEGFKPVADFISGNIETPSQLAKRNVEVQMLEAPQAAQNTNNSIKMNAAFQAGLEQMGLVAASTFTNVLLSRLLDKVKALLKPDADRSRHVLPDLGNPFAAGLGSTKPKELFASQYSDLLTPRVTRQEDADILGELSACPRDARGRWHCSLDESFALALRQGSLTVRQAIDQGFINENWQFIPSTKLKDNQDPTCRSRAFCAANLKKLRLARIIPIGWELAADSSENQAGCTAGKGCITLGEVIRKYDDCSATGTLDKTHPYCHLVDPNWVLTSFPAQCLVKGFSNVLFPAGGRMDECQDTTLCLQRDADGKCIGGFGYCMAEQTFWQFKAPKCEEQFASCRTFQPRGSGAKPVNYVRATLDYGSCNESNVGCMWYATKHIPDRADDPSGWNNGYASTTDRVYFDKTMQTCDAKSDGCSALKKVVSGQSALNLVRNGSFESVTSTAESTSVLVGWTNVDDSGWKYAAPEPGTGTPSAHGGQAVALPAGDDLRQIVRGARELHTYTLSFYGRRYVGNPDGGQVFVTPLDDTDNVINKGASDPTYFRSATCNFLAGAGSYASGVSIASESGLGDEWVRYSCTFVTPRRATNIRLTVKGGVTNEKSPLIDAVQLEEADQPTEFVDGLSPALETVNMKIPPDELACTGEPTQRAACDKYARVCRQTEAGCQGYRSITQASLPEIPAVLSARDICPAECVGYAEFRKQHSTFDLVHDLDVRLDDPEDDSIAPFVPGTANSCAVQEVGCERFTNLDSQALGGESESGFIYLRSCEKPGPDSQTFYTWEGSDTTGFQLRTWSLKRDTTQPLPQPPKVIVKPGADGILKDPNTCNLATYLQARDPDCRQYYDPEGNVFYRFETQTVLSSDTCAQLRKDGSNTADCTKTGGTFLSASNQCVYLADTAKSSSCEVANAGCREYIGTQGKVQEEILSEEFSSASSTALKGQNTTISSSDENILVGDKSLKISVTAGNTGSIRFNIAVEPGALYELSFWAKTTDAARPTITARTTDQPTSLATTQIEVDWKTYRIGPFTGTSGGLATTTQLTLVGFTKDTFMDKVRVSRVEDRVYVVKDSWNTPASCDRTPEGIPQPQAMLGCQTFVDRKGKQVNARQFTRLCRDTAIGCTAFVNTMNTETPYQLTWSRPAIPSGNERTIREADRYDYYIDDASKYCSAAQVSCRAFGVPQFTQDRLGLRSPAGTNEGNKGEPFKTVYLKDDATKYDEGICSEKELFCESYTSVGGTDYFRAPADHACEYKKAIVIDASCGVANTAGATFDGWFKTGTTCPCYPDRLVQGRFFGIRYAGDPGYNRWNGSKPDGTPDPYPDDGKVPDGVRAWAAMCPEQQAECTEFRDVVDVSDPLHPLGRPYFVIKDNSLDTTSCNGQVDPARGCVLFRDMSDTRLTASTAATAREYTSRAYQPVAPLNCDLQPNHPNCTQKVCRYVAGANISLVVPFLGTVVAPFQIGEDCSSNTDCQICTGAGPCDNSLTECGTPPSDVNLIVKVKPDRACSEWLSCASGETVYDPAEGKYKGICTDLQLCNKAGEPEGAGLPYCSNYVDRTKPSELLGEDVIIDANVYAARPTGFGQKDYSGFTIPDHFQIMDGELAPMGSITAQDPQTKSRYTKDYRLAVPVPLTAGKAHTITAAEAGKLSLTDKEKAAACVLDQNGAYGYASGGFCWVSIDQSQPPQLAGSGEPITSDNLNVFSLITRFRQSTVPSLDPILSRSFPQSQCKAAPEGDSPFGNEYVLEWDDTVTPAQPKRVADGYGGVKFCEYGEECACTYKRVQYGGSTKFYEPLSTSEANAVCSGGPRDGLPCVLDIGIKGNGPTGSFEAVPEGGTEKVKVDLAEALKGEGEGNPPDPLSSCGDGGLCTPISKSTLVRGITGQCLEYDSARVVAGDQTRNECLVWSPNPVLSGPSDIYHWSPSAGWAPPISSGRYYCTSPYRQPQTFAFRTDQTVTFLGQTFTFGQPFGFTKNSAGTYAGLITNFSYSDDIASDKSCVDIPNPFGDDCDGNEGGGSLDGHRAEGTDMGAWCEEADDDQTPGTDGSLYRMVTTGAGRNHGYAEYAIPVNFFSVAAKIAGQNPAVDCPGQLFCGDSNEVKEFTSENSISSFSFSTDYNKIGCEYSEDFGGVGGMDYDDRDSWEPKDKEWQANFKAEMAKSGNKLDRKSAKIVTEDGSQGAGSIPVKVKCANSANEPEDKSGCFQKVWQLDYKSEGEEKFQGFGPDIGRGSLDSLSKSPVYGACTSDHSWFSIRAVFEDSDPGENNQDPEDVQPNNLAGPFQFVGFWVTACSPASGPRYIYMYVNMSTADICKELAETISKDSHEAVAFTDRNSPDSGFAIPRAGYTWGTTNVPFGASLATADAGIEPLYMTGVKQAASNPLHPPVFTFPGQTYFRADKYPTSNWGMLSNVFARIYRIYGYYIQGVSRSDWACTSPDSPNFTGWCPREASATQATQYCGLEAKCSRGGLTASSALQNKACNTFSGVNRGLDCTTDPDICHRGPVELNELDGVLKPAFAGCARYADSAASISWEKLQASRNWRCTGSGCPTGGDGGECSTCATAIGCARPVAVRCGALRCDRGSARGRDNVKATSVYSAGPGIPIPYETKADFCTSEKDQSSECPARLVGEKCVAAGGGTAVCEQHPWAQCNSDNDCEYEARNFWFGSIGNATFAWGAAKTPPPPGYLGNWIQGVRGEATPAEEARYGYVVDPDAGPKDFESSGLQKLCPGSKDAPECILKEGVPVATIDDDESGTKPELPFFATPLIGNGSDSDTTSGKFIEKEAWNDLGQLNLYPGFLPNIASVGDQCSPNFGSYAYKGCKGTYEDGGNYLAWEDLKDSPVGGHWIVNTEEGVTEKSPSCHAKSGSPSGSEAACQSVTNGQFGCNLVSACEWVVKTGSIGAANANLKAHYAACEPVALMYRAGATANNSLGLCKGGARSGATCFVDKDCRPPGMTPARFDELQGLSKGWCNPVAPGDQNELIQFPVVSGGAVLNSGNQACYGLPVTRNATDAERTTALGASNAPQRESDPKLDNNICTHPPGYWPRPNLCKDPNDEYCGLFGYDLTLLGLGNSVNDNAPLPTDVTQGLSTPKFLNSNTSQVKGTAIDYNYLEFYNPIPPQIAAPDMRTCTGGQCRISSLGSVSLDGANEGVVNGGAGSHVATMRFYAWASHEQMPLRRIVIDWGDGAQTELPDAHMKNRKPYCETEKECQFAPGLTCDSDSDCPPAAGLCVTWGSCANRPNTRCFRDAQCEFGGEPGICNPRVYFGNKQEACEEQYFEFRHAYACLPNNKPVTCDTNAGRCSRNPEVTCSIGCTAGAADCCQKGDSCIRNLVPKTGCFETSSNVCRFTPRLLVVDNWGWCSGECRYTTGPSGTLIDPPLGVRHPFGGCYDGSRVKSNVNQNAIVWSNECSTTLPLAGGAIGGIERPWIVFPGSIQLLTGEAQ